MAGFWSRLFGGASEAGPKARRVTPTVNPKTALAQHPVVDLAEKGRSAALDLPLWVDEAPESLTPPTYEHILWETQPRGEYLYYLAGAFEKNEKGLLRFGSAPEEFRVVRSHETDVLEAAKHELPDSEGRDWRELFKGETCATLAQRIDRAAGAPGPKGWTLGHVTGIDPSVGMALMRVEPGAGIDGAPQVSLIFRKIVPQGEGVPVEYGIQVLAVSRRAETSIIALMDGFRDLVMRYRDMPYTEVRGALRV